MPRKHERELEDLLAGLRDNSSHKRIGTKKEEKNDFKACSQFAFMFHKYSSNHSSQKDFDNEESKNKLPSCMYDDFHAHLVDTNLKTQASNMHEKSKKKVKKEFFSIYEGKIQDIE